MRTAFIIPTGIGCRKGGHAGDATPAVKCIAEVSDTCFLHPNVVNASDINEMPHNSLYVEGSMLDSFLEGEIGLQRSRGNRVLVAVNPPVKPETVNAVNAAISTIGMDASIIELEEPLVMQGWIDNGQAVGNCSGVASLIYQLRRRQDYDALAIATPISVSPEQELEYLRKDTDLDINPWGGIEAHVSRRITESLKVPVAHAPVEDPETESNPELMNLLYQETADPRSAAEICSNCYLHCVLKGLHKAPRIGSEFNRQQIDALISPYGCVDRPHYACFEAGIPVIAVRSNPTSLQQTDQRIHYVENYLEAAGLIACMGAGMNPVCVK